MVILGWLYYDTYMNSPADCFEQSISLYQDILDVAAGLRNIVPDGGDSLSAAELEGKVKRSAVRVKLKATDVAYMQSRKEEKEEEEQAKPPKKTKRVGKRVYSAAESVGLQLVALTSKDLAEVFGA